MRCTFCSQCFLSCSQCAFERGGVESHELCLRYLFVVVRLFSHDPVHFLTFCPYDPSAFLTRATQCWLNTPIGNSGSSPLLCMFCKKHRCWKQNWCHVDGTVPRALETLRLASAWCTPTDAGNMRTASKEFYEAFEHTLDVTTMARIELKHAEYFAQMTALKWVRYSTKLHGQIICSGRTRLVRTS